MSWTRVCSLLAVAAATLTAGGQGDYVPAEPLREAGMKTYWQLQLPLEVDQQVQHVHRVDDHLYVGTQDGYAYCVHAPTGVLRWVRPITRSGYALRRPAHAGENVIFVTPPDVQVYELHSGAPVQRRDLDFPAGTGGLSDGTRLFIGGLDRRFYTLDVESLYLDWRVVTSGPIASGPGAYEDSLFFANDAGDVYCCTRKNKVLTWRSSGFGPISADLVVTEAGVFVASRDFSLYLLDLKFGNVRWRARCAGPLFEAPVVTPDTVYQFCRAEGLVAIEATVVDVVESRIRWRLPEGRSALTMHEDAVYVLSSDGRLLRVTEGTGAIEASAPAAGFTMAVPSPGDATAFVFAPDGRIACLRPMNVPPLRKEAIVEALRGPEVEDALTARVTPTTRPARMSEDPLSTKRRGMPVGGKSKVSRDFQGGSSPE